MQIDWKAYLDPARWIPMAIVLVIGLVGGFCANLLLGADLEMLGIIIASVLGVLLFCVMCLVFCLLFIMQRRARWAHEQAQTELKARLKMERSEARDREVRHQQEQAAILAWLARVAPAPEEAMNPEMLAQLQAAMDLAKDDAMPLTEKLVKLQAIVQEMKKR